MAFFISSMQQLIVIVLCMICLSCSQSELKEPVEYTGPLREVEKIERYDSENDMIKSKLTADLFYEYGNGDQEFPKGINVEMYNEFGRLQSTLKANYAKYIKEKSLAGARKSRVEKR